MKAYTDAKGSIQWVVNEITSWLWMLAGLAIAVVVFATLAKLTGYPIRMLPTLDPTPLAYLCGAYWLARK